MVRSFLVRAAWGMGFFAATFVFLNTSKFASAEESANVGAPSTEPKPVEFFKAIEDKQIEAILIPRDSKAMVLQVVNKTDQALTIQAPRVFAGVPVLEQALPPANKNVFGPTPNKTDKAPQKLVATFNPNGQNNAFKNGLNGPNNRPNGLNANPLFSIPPEKTLRFTVACVCIEHGKPDPSPHYPYEIRSVDSASDKPQIRQVVDLLGSGKYTQRVAQIAAWHFSDDLSWQALADLQIKHLNGAKVQQFTGKEIEQAKQLVAELPPSNAGKGKTTTAVTAN